MTTSSIALGFAVVRGIQLVAVTVPWVLTKMRNAGASESERSLLRMIGSRSVLLGLVMVTLGIAGRRAPLGWVLLGDGLLQLFDAIHGLALHKRAEAILPTVFCILDGLAAAALIANATG